MTMVGCERSDGTLNIHAETDTCDVCSPFSEHEHEWVEAVDENGNLIEPAFDICVQCGARQD